MVAIVIPNTSPFGNLTNSSVGRLAGINTSLLRLNEAIATASDGFNGIPGTEFEAAPVSTMTPLVINNFSIQQDPENPGANGQTYADAMVELVKVWRVFWDAAQPYIKQLDNGSSLTVPGMTG